MVVEHWYISDKKGLLLWQWVGKYEGFNNVRQKPYPILSSFSIFMARIPIRPLSQLLADTTQLHALNPLINLCFFQAVAVIAVKGMTW